MLVQLHAMYLLQIRDSNTLYCWKVSVDGLIITQSFQINTVKIGVLLHML